MRRVELFAYPAWHSLSPAMHNAAFGALGLDVHYAAREVPPEELQRAVAELRSGEILGANVTIPHKELIVPLLDTLSTEARAVGAVNTVVNRGGELCGETTDVTGFLRALAELGVDVDGATVLLLGAGGAGRSVAYALLTAGAGELLVHNRSRPRAERLASDLRAYGTLRVVGEGDVASLARGVRLVVNATSVGMMRQGVSLDDTPLPAELLPSEGAVMDLVYRPARTRLLREAEQAGLAVQNGIPMLLYQGAESFTSWTGMEAPVGVMREALDRALAG